MVSTVGGNAPLKHTSPGFDMLMEVAGISPTQDFHPFGVARGYGWRDMHVAWPKMRSLDRWSPDVPSSRAAADLIISAARASGAEGLTVVTLGPVTNLAAALDKAPDIASRLRRLVM